MDGTQTTKLTKFTKFSGATRATETIGNVGVTGAIGATRATGDVEASGLMQVKKAIEGRGKEVKEKDLCPPGPGFQAIILCGPGTSLYPFTGVEELLPKALIPIANKPMILYPLEWCQKGRFESILVLTLAEHLVAIQAYLKSHVFPFNIQVEAPSALDENLGTADVLRRAYREGWITGDIAVLPCDLITDLDPNELVKIWMVENAGFDCDMGKRNVDYANCREDDERRGGLGIWYDVRGEGQIKGQETDFLALAPHREPSLGSTPESQFPGVLKSLLFNLPGQEVMNKEERPFRKSLLRKFPNIQINQTVRDSGIYFLPFWVLRFIDKNSKMNSIREDVLPWWSKARWQNKRLAEKLGLLEILSDGGDTFEQRLNLAEMSSSRKRNVEKWTQQDVTAQRVYSSLDLEVLEKLKRGAAVSKKPATPELSTNIPSRPPPPPPPPPPGGTKIPPIIVYLPGSSGNFTRRVDTVHLYHSMCLFIASPAFKSDQIKINPSASIDRTATINGLDCLISAKVSIAGEALIQRSVLGFGVSIGRGAIVIGSVLMDGASVAEGASVEGCILGKNVIIGADAKLKDCKVAPGLFVEPGNQAVGEIMTAFDGVSNDNTPRKYGSNPDNSFQFGCEDQSGQEQSKWDGFFSGDKAVQNVVQGEARAHNSAEDHENSEAIGSHGDIKDSDGIEVSEDLENLGGLEDLGDLKDLEDLEDLGDLEDTENYENIEGHKKNGADQRVNKNLKNNGNQIDKAEVININTPEEVNFSENNYRVQGYLGKTLETRIEQQIDGKNTIPEFSYKIDKETHLKRNQEPRSLPEPRLVRRDSSETEALYKEAATKDIANAFSSPNVDQSNLASIQAASKVVSPTQTPSTSKKTSVLGWSTWGLSVITLGICFAFFIAICTVVERRGHFLDQAGLT